MKTIEEVRDILGSRKDRSAWDKGVTIYALELLADIEENRNHTNGDRWLHPLDVKTEALNGATSWEQYSYGGCALIFDSDIAERLCCPSELRKVRSGDRNPNSRETWLDVQARALQQACTRIKWAAR